jgi:hypothetical protein
MSTHLEVVGLSKLGSATGEQSSIETKPVFFITLEESYNVLLYMYTGQSNHPILPSFSTWRTHFLEIMK